MEEGKNTDWAEVGEPQLHDRPFVSEDAHGLSLHFSHDALQSLMNPENPNQLEIPYTRTMMGFLLMKPQPIELLMIGLGGGSIAKFCHAYLPQTRITVVEINPHVIALRDRFQIPADDARFCVVHGDGADFVRDTTQRFDAILVDGFDAQGQSSQLSSTAFYQQCAGALTPQGVMVANLDGDHPAHTAFLRRVHTAFHGNVVGIGVPDRSNHVVFALQGPAICASRMSLSDALGHTPVPAQMQLKAELQRILHLLDGLPSVGQSSLPWPPITG